MLRAISFGIFFVIVASILFGMNYWVLSRFMLLYTFKLKLRWIIFITLVIMALMIILRSFWHPSTSIFHYIYFAAFGLLWLSFNVMILYEILRHIKAINPLIFQISVPIITLGIFIYSLISGLQIHITEYNMTSDKLRNTLKIAHISDTHLGAILDKNFMRRIVKKTNALNPDLVCITGDFVEEPRAMLDGTFSLIDSFKAPVFFVTGNHEAYTNLGLVISEVNKTNAIILRDQAMIFENVFQIVGVDDPGRDSKWDVEKILDDIVLSEKYFTIFLTHRPVYFDKIQNFNIDLELAGHTHAGQIFPFNIPVMLAYPNHYGLETKNGQNMIVSSGTGNWGPPMRLGSKNEINIITVNPVK